METILGSALINALGGFAEHFVFCFFWGAFCALGGRGKVGSASPALRFSKFVIEKKVATPEGLKDWKSQARTNLSDSEGVPCCCVCKGKPTGQLFVGLVFRFLKESQKGQLFVRGGSSRNLGLHVFLSLKANQQDSLFALAGGRSRICWGVLSFFGVGTRIVGVDQPFAVVKPPFYSGLMVINAVGDVNSEAEGSA